MDAVRRINNIRILYIGSALPTSTSRHRAGALGRLSHEVIIADPYTAFSSQLRGRLQGALHYRSGFRLLQKGVCAWVENLGREHAPNPPGLVWVNSGELLGYKATVMLKRFGCPIVLYNNDDPTGKRDGRRFDSLLKALPAYDLCAVRNPHSLAKFRQGKASADYRVWMSYDEIAHRPFDNPADIPEQFRSEVAFVGAWIPGERRDKFLLELKERGVPVSIWGGAWEKSPNWRNIKPLWRGPSIWGRDYVAALQGAKLAIGMLCHGDGDLRTSHTRRSVEIPYVGGLLCAERTADHLTMYQEGVEAVFWNDADECAAECHRLLGDDRLRERIRAAGAERVRQGAFGNEAVCREILLRLFPAEGVAAMAAA